MYKEKFDLSGKVAILTGGTGLIGTAFGEGLAESGCKVVICDIDQKSCDNRARVLEKEFGVGCVGIAADVSNKSDVERLLTEVLKKFEKVDILVTSHQNKTANFFEKFEGYPEKDWDDIISVNLKGVFLCCQIIGKQMLKQGYGNIINIASTYGVVSPNQEIYKGTKIGSPAAYSASKGGVIALTKYLATYWADKNIRVNAISPHGVFNNHEKKFVENFSKKSPLKRMSYKEEVVGALIFLASDASSYVTGHNLMVDGGWSVW
jgi:NAD(P)-dependent dehydrogenase (short-subunit alcohol dehydrogenase family)